MVGTRRGIAFLPPNPTKGAIMFKVIGAVVVYGFALFGLSKYLEALQSGE
jgi:hypothetical protein